MAATRGGFHGGPAGSHTPPPPPVPPSLAAGPAQRVRRSPGGAELPVPGHRRQPRAAPAAHRYGADRRRGWEALPGTARDTSRQPSFWGCPAAQGGPGKGGGEDGRGQRRPVASFYCRSRPVCAKPRQNGSLVGGGGGSAKSHISNRGVQ